MIKKNKYHATIIDDSKISIVQLKRVLQSFNIEVESYTDPNVGLEAVLKKPPTVLFLDYMMPTMQGDKLIVRLSERNIFQHTSIVLYSGCILNSDDLIKLRTLGFECILGKPPEREAVAKIVNEMLGANISHDEG